MRKKTNERIQHHLKLFSKRAESSFSPYFAKKVLNKIDDMEKKEKKMIDFHRSLKAAFRKIVLVGALVLLILLSYNIKIGDNFSEEEAVFASEAVYKELNKLPLF
jgi:hypothetical protein